MQDDFLKEARSLASRLELGRSDMQSRRLAEQDFRAFGARVVGSAVRWAGIATWRRFVALLHKAPSENLSAEQPQNPV